MENMYDKPRLWKKIIRGTLDCVIAVVLVCAVLSSIIVHGVLDSEKCKNAVCNDEFDLSVETYVRQCFDATSAVIELSGDRIVQDVGVSNLTAYAREYTRQFIDSVYNGTEFVPAEFDNERFKNSIYTQLAEYTNGEITDAEIEEIYNEALKNIHSVLRYVPQITMKLVGKITPMLQKLQVLKNLEIPLYCIAAILITVNFMFGRREHFYDIFLGISSALWVVFVTVEIPFIMVALYDVPSKIVIGESLFLYLIKGINTIAVTYTAIFLGICLVAVTVLLAVAITLVALRTAKQTEKEEKLKKYQKLVDKTEQQ